jgi:mannose-6-phosphate isomerase-like protein (cupin superfamily)
MERHLWTFHDGAAFQEVRPGFRRQVITGDETMLCLWRINGGLGPTPYAPHLDNEQFGLIVAGQLDFRIGSEERHVLGPGDVYWAPKGFPHGDSRFVGDAAHGETWILDMFVPPRDEYRDG